MATRIWHSIASDEEFEVAWIDVATLERLWPAQYRVASWTGPPRENWFMRPSVFDGLKLPSLSLSASEADDPITFINGRHRSRWMISLGHSEIPVGIPASQVELGEQMGLIKRIARPEDVLP